jgi:hypothetical protein
MLTIVFLYYQFKMGVGVVLWVVGKFLVKHVVDSMLPSLVSDPSTVPSDIPVLSDPYLYYFSCAEIPCLKRIRF